MEHIVTVEVGFRGPAGPRGPESSYADRAEAESTEVPAPVQTINVAGLSYVRDVNGTALTTGDGGTWSPANEITSRHFGSPLNGEDDDAPAIQAAIDYAVASGANRVTVSGVPFISNIVIPGEVDVTFEGPQIAIGDEGFAITVTPGSYQRRSKLHGLNLQGNPDMDGGVLMEAAQYWTIYDPVINGFEKPGAWAMVMSGDASNRNSGSNLIINPNFSNCNNMLKFGKNPEIVGSQNTGSSFNTIIGGYLGPYGDYTETMNYGVLVEVGEGNKFINVRASTNKHHTCGWEVMDSRTTLIGCAGDGPMSTAFVYPLAGAGTVNSITLLSVPLLETPVEWQGTRQATADAILAQIEADGNQYPNTEFMSMSHDEQVMFFRVDADENLIPLSASELSGISVSVTGMTMGNSSIAQGLLQGAPYNQFRDVTQNEWGYRTGHGGVWEAYGFRFRANPEGQGRGGGAIIEPEGNGPRHMISFDSELTQRSVNISQPGATVYADDLITTDAVMKTADGQIQATATTGNVSIVHTQQRLRLINLGPLVFAEFSLAFTPTITTNGQLFFEFPQATGVYYTTEPLNVNGMQYRIPVSVTGTSETGPLFFVIQGGTTSVNGHPYARLSRLDGTLISTASMTSGTAVNIRGWGHWPVNRFGD